MTVLDSCFEFNGGEEGPTPHELLQDLQIKLLDTLVSGLVAP